MPLIVGARHRAGLLAVMAVSFAYAGTDVQLKLDEALGLMWHIPRRPPAAASHEGLFKADTYYWRCYPVIAQSIAGDKKALLLRIDLDGPGYWDIRYDLVVNVDGHMQQISFAAENIAWYTTLGLTRGAEITVPDSSGVVSRMAEGKVVWLTLFGWSDQHHSVRLSEKQLAVIQDMVEYYRKP